MRIAVIVLLAIALALSISITDTALAQAPEVECERYGCVYEHERCRYTRTGPQCEYPRGIAFEALPDGEDGRRFVTVQWPAGYNPVRRAMWDRVAHCESRLQWYIATGNGYYGGLQFSKSSWDYVGGTRYAAYPHHAWPAQQIAIAERLLDTPPYERHWPHCGPRAGLHR